MIVDFRFYEMIVDSEVILMESLEGLLWIKNIVLSFNVYLYMYENMVEIDMCDVLSLVLVLIIGDLKYWV